MFYNWKLLLVNIVAGDVLVLENQAINILNIDTIFLIPQ